MKRFLSVILLFLIIIQIPGLGFASSTDPSIYEPTLQIESREMPVLKVGTNTIQIVLKVANNNIRDLVVVPEFDRDSPITSNSFTNSISIGNVKMDAKVPINLDLLLSPTAKEATYPITLNFNYKYYVYEGEGEDKTLRLQNGSYRETIFVKVDNTSQPRLLISKVTTNPAVITANQDFKLNVYFENKGSFDFNNVSVKLSGLNHDGGFYIASGSDTKVIKNVPKSLISYESFHLKAADNIREGGHKLDVTFIYNGIEDTQSIYLNVVEDKEESRSSNLLIENIVEPNTSVKANEDFIIRFDLRNNGDIDAKNILVRVESTDPVILPKTTNIERINSIAPNSSETLEFVFSPTEDAISKSYPISIDVEYEDESEKRPSLNQYVGAYVEVEDDDSDDTVKGKPRLIIDKYSFEPQLVRAGENFEMKLSFYNTSSNKTVKNIKIFLTAEPGGTNPDSPSAGGSVFTPVDSSNTFYIDSIPPKGRVEKTITMFTVPDALAKTHTIIANFEYEDNEGNPLDDQERIGVPVVQQSKLDTSELTLYPDTMVGQPVPVSLEFYNTGKVTLYNLMVKLEGDFQTEHGSYYVGNFASGSSDYFEGMVIPNMPGELNGAVVFTYEDSTGQMQEVRKGFTLNVMDMPPMEEFPHDMPPMDGFEPEAGGIKGMLKSKWLWISLGAVIVIVGGIVIYRKKKKAKEMAFDE